MPNLYTFNFKVGFLFRLYASILSGQYGYFCTVQPKDMGIIMSALAVLQPDMLKILLRGRNVTYEVVEPVLPCIFYVENTEATCQHRIHVKLWD